MVLAQREEVIKKGLFYTNGFNMSRKVYEFLSSQKQYNFERFLIYSSKACEDEA